MPRDEHQYNTREEIGGGLIGFASVVCLEYMGVTVATRAEIGPLKVEIVRLIGWKRKKKKDLRPDGTKRVIIKCLKPEN